MESTESTAETPGQARPVIWNTDLRGLPAGHQLTRALAAFMGATQDLDVASARNGFDCETAVYRRQDAYAAARELVPAAQAVLDQAFPGLRRQLDEARAALRKLADGGNLEARHLLASLTLPPLPEKWAEPQPAPELAAQPPSPEPDGTIVIGPHCFATADSRVISWRGINYYPWASDPDHQVLPSPELPAAVERAEKAERACKTLGHVVDVQARILYAAGIEIARGDTASAAQWVLNAQLDQWDGEPWNGKETGDEWFERTRDTQEHQPAHRERVALEAIMSIVDGLDEPGPEADAIRLEVMRGLGEDAGDSVADHPDDCRGTCCEDARRDARAQDDGGDDFVQDRHADLDAGEFGGAMTDADYYDRTMGVAAEQERDAERHARDMAAEDGDLDDCEPTL